MVEPPEDERNARLNALFRAYHEACEAPEPSANFMPLLWQRIERSQTVPFVFRRIARGFVTAAVALSLVLAGMDLVASRNTHPVVETYVEVLASHNSVETELVGGVLVETGSDSDLI